jgi:hypothetical protein
VDVIDFRVVRTSHWYGDGVEIRINGVPLPDLVRPVELPFAEAEGNPKIAGAYSGLPASIYLPPSRHFRGESRSGRSDGKVELLGCGDCGEVGCWPLLARIVVGPDQVVWSDFEQPYRGDPEKVAVWRYDRFGPFEFGRADYEAALLRVAGPAP